MLPQTGLTLTEVIGSAATQISVAGLPLWATTSITTATITTWCAVRLLGAVLPSDSADRLRLWLAVLDHRGKRRFTAARGDRRRRTSGRRTLVNRTQGHQGS